jgi:hypothetical protein
MFKGTVMLIATLVSNAYASTPMQEANLLITKSSQVSHAEDPIVQLVIMLDERKLKLDETILEAKKAYFALSEDSSIYEVDKYEELEILELNLRGMSSYLKKVWLDNSDEILAKYGSDAHEKFRYLVAKTGQLRKNVSNILRIGAEVKGLVIKVEETAFKPNEEFMISANLATQNAYIH